MDSEGQDAIAFVYGSPDFTFVGGALLRWVQAVYPQDADLVGFGLWDTIEEALQNGLLFA